MNNKVVIERMQTNEKFSNQVEGKQTSLHFEAYGFMSDAVQNPETKRYYGDIYSMDPADDPQKKWGGYAGDNPEEAEHYFRVFASHAAYTKEYTRRNQEWQKSGVDTEGILDFISIRPDNLRKRIQSGEFDKKLLKNVDGMDFDVPIYYVTKAWELLFNHAEFLDEYGFFIGYDEEDDDEDDCDEEEKDERTFEEAVAQNNEIKQILKDELGIDIDHMGITFHQFNKHLTPHVSESEMEDYFGGVPYGVCEWLLCGVNNPWDTCYYDFVSGLMEFVAYIQKKYYYYR